jgi:hypothetical protein
MLAHLSQCVGLDLLLGRRHDCDGTFSPEIGIQQR